ncbi:MAG: secretin N-terminal domain-containing protein [Candidatus Omnitrophota bacterium]
MKKIIIYIALFSISLFLIMPFVFSQTYEDQPELISLDIKGMDIHDVLKILSQKSGLNIVSDSDVKGTVVIYIKDVSAMDALDIVVTTNGLAYEEDGTLIRVMTDRQYEKLHGERFSDRTKTEIVKLNYANASEVSKALIKMKTNIGNIIADDSSNTIVLMDSPANIEKMKKAIAGMDVLLTTEVFSLDYAKAEEIKDKLSEMLSKGIGSIKFDERTNKVVVSDTPKKIEDIKKVIEAFDEKTREVVIDANIIEVTLSDANSLGINWNAVAKAGDIRFEGTLNLSATAGIEGTLNQLKFSTGGDHEEILNLLKTYGRTDVLSRPRITAIDKQEAKILVGSKEVYVTSTNTTTDGGTVTVSDNVQFVDVGVSLTVTPYINKMGFVLLKIKPEVSSTSTPVELLNADGTVRSRIPTVQTSQAETTVLVKDNTTLIIGGLMKDKMIDDRQKVPFLGDIPLLGKLFSATGKSKIKTEIVVFLTPHIIEGDETTEEAQKYIIDWDRKIKKMNIETPKEDRIELSDAAPEKEKQPKQKFKPVFESKRNKETKSLSPDEEYYFIVTDEVNNIAKRQDVSGLKGEVGLKLALDKKGFITKEPVALTKSDPKLVKAAINAVKRAMPFPPLPKALSKDTAEFHIVVEYE